MAATKWMRMLSIGLMSGTSMDGIDAALLETDGTSKLINDLGHFFIPYDPAFKILLKAAEYAIRQCKGNLDDAKVYYIHALEQYLQQELHIRAIHVPDKINSLIAYMHSESHSQEKLTLDTVIQHSTFLHGLAVKQILKKTGYRAEQIDVVGYHGQAMYHQPTHKISVIVGDGQALADQIGITVVNDFRSRDIAAGGQGAPFAPLYHQALAVRDNKLPLAVVNCGGIANVTVIKNADPLDLIGFDTGPGNALIDRLVKRRTHGKQDMDTNGQFGKRGTMDVTVLNALYAKAIIKDGKNYFSIKPPKSLDYGDMILIPELDALSLEDACATLEVFTADSIVRSMEMFNREIPQHWVLAGGGWKNPLIKTALVTRLKAKMGSNVQVQFADEIGWNSQAMEAQIFAFLAVRSLNHQPLSFPNTTGVAAPLTGGQAYYANL